GGGFQSPAGGSRNPVQGADPVSGPRRCAGNGDKMSSVHEFVPGSPAAQSIAAHIRLANPRGFCAGVDRAIDIVNRALDIYGAPIYVRHEVVHNKIVVETLRQRGAVFVDELTDIPSVESTGRSSIVIFSAHGVAQLVKEEAEQRGFKIFDATCP